MKLGQAIHERRARHRIATNTDAGGHAYSLLLQLEQRLVGERAGARHDADVLATWGWCLGNFASGNANVAAPWADDARAVGAEQSRVRKVALECGIDPCFILSGHTFGDADDESHAGCGGLQDCSRCRFGRHCHERCVGTSGLDGISDAVENGNAFNVLSAFAWGHATHHVGAIGAIAQTMKLALTTREALHDYLRVLVDENCHG